MNFHPDKKLFFKLPAPRFKPLTLGLQSQRSTSTPWGTHFVSDLSLLKRFSKNFSFEYFQNFQKKILPIMA
jgi:hypothetical protein